jgi:hypothetical protein
MESVTTLSIYLPAHAVVMGLFIVGAGCHMKGLHHIEGNLDSLQYKHILQNVQVPLVRMLYPDSTGGQEVTVPRPIRYYNLIWITYTHLVTCQVDPYVHLDAGHTNGCASMSSVTYIRAF